MVVGSQNDGKDFMVFTDSPIDGTQIFRCWNFIVEIFYRYSRVNYKVIGCQLLGEEIENILRIETKLK